MTFASTDWIMSLDPHWFSTIFGFIFVAGQGLAAFALVIIVLVDADADRAVRDLPEPALHFLDLGKLLLAFVMLWAYFSFSQFLIIWSGNLPEEIPFFVDRLRGGWQYVSAAILLGHFALPFALLLSRDLKRRPRLLAQVAVVILLMRVRGPDLARRADVRTRAVPDPLDGHRAAGRPPGRLVLPLRAQPAQPAAAAAERSVLQGGVRA